MNDDLTISGADGGNPAKSPLTAQPQRIGRYRIEKLLGQGGFAVVYLAHDEELQRRVAVKVPHRRRLSTPEDVASFVAEARTVAGLDHPNIVPVYDVGSAEDFPCFIVSKYVQGVPLSERIKASRLSTSEAAELVATIAEALHYAHRKKFVHRDVKPGNILIDTAGMPFVVDFGLASKEEKIGRGIRCVGTPAYMSPEQARGEGHRVDGRSDVFSLGVVFYELLTASRPFNGDSKDELLEQVRSCDPRPPRQHDDGIPRELERICMKALSKRASDRYSTANDLAEDLRSFMNAVKGQTVPGDGMSGGKVDTGSLSHRMGLSHSQRAKAARSTFVFADFKGFAERVRILEQAAGHQAAAEMRRRIVQYVDDAFRGLQPVLLLKDSLIDTAGDGFFFHFRNAVDAFRFIEALHKATSQHTAEVTDEIADHWFRAGAATGDAAWEGGYPIGHVVNVASRLQSASTGGDLVVDRDTFDGLSPDVRKQFSPREVIRDKHDKAYEVYRNTFGRVLPPLASPVNSAVNTLSFTNARPIKIVPKGLRSFDAHDADFFLDLLPGPCDRDGLPDTIRFWKTRIEETDADNTFAVGLIYGPSGCGKSSLVKAGLLPLLSKSVTAVYVEATAEETETRLLNGLRRRCPALPANLSLRETLAAIRRGEGVSAGRKMLIVLDQFEQWLHARREEENTELVQALRQCDGTAVQCIVMVRDDFWMAVTRFMRELEVRLVEAQNSAAVDLFPIRHARKVLAAFGRAFGALPDSPGEANKEQESFITQSLAGVSEEGKVICVRLALFAEMMKGRPWTPASLNEVGGTEGVGVAFLDETFSAATAPPQHRYHQKAARAVLKSLLPESGTDIKGHMRSRAELLEASGYANRPKDFDDLIRILDGEIRLLTPTDPQGKEGNEEYGQLTRGRDRGDGQDAHATKYYQLTHDYLVPSLRDWLTRKQKETRRGRAELLLADRAGVWNARPENRQLPSLRQWLGIRSLTRKKSWTPPQRKMMDKATVFHAVRATASGVMLASVIVAGLAIRSLVAQQQKATTAAGLVKRVIDADTAQVPAIVGEIGAYRQWADPLLRQENGKATAESRQKLRTSLALLPVDAGQVEFLYGRLLTAEPNEVPVIRDALLPHKNALIDRLWSVVEKPEKGKEPTRLRAAAALAEYDPQGKKWTQCSPLVVNDLVRENPIFVGQWSEAFRPVKNHLLSALAATFRDPQPERLAERNLATNLLADYAADQPQVLADLLMDADEKQFAVIFPKFARHSENGLPILTSEIDRKLPATMPSSDDRREKLAKRQANAAVALLRLNQPAKVWPMLRHSPDPRARSYLIHRFSPLGADARTIIKQFDGESDASVRRALILSVGEFGEQDLSPDERKVLTTKLQDLYRTAADPGLHGAVEWLLRTWKQEAWLKQTNEDWAKDNEHGERKIDGKEKTPQWYVNSQGQTMVVIPGPLEFVMGSPLTEANRQDSEPQHKRRIGRTFALAATPVTKEQFLRFQPGFSHTEMKRYPEPACPIGGVIWYEAAKYCNWLSRQEGIPEDQWCYEIENGQVTKLKEGYLGLTGYRLPTEAEMEYATRAGAITSRYYGETEDLLSKYAWYLRNSDEKTWPVGSKKPNDLGFFDVHGNVFCWCQEAYKTYPHVKDGEAADDKEGELNIVATSSRVLRGGSFDYQASVVRSAFRSDDVPSYRVTNLGFRAARTLRPVHLTPLPPPP